MTAPMRRSPKSSPIGNVWTRAFATSVVKPAAISPMQRISVFPTRAANTSRFSMMMITGSRARNSANRCSFSMSIPTMRPGGGMVVIDETGQQKLRCLKLEHDADLKRWALLSNPIAHSTAMFRRSLANLCGGYDENLSGFQDWDLFLKLGQHG